MANEILVKHPRNWGLDEELVKRLADKALKEKGYNNQVELSILFVGRKKARELNIKYRNKDYYPQVLGFPMSRQADADGWLRLGDIVICTQKLKYEAKYLKNSMEEVLYSWLVHGVENLLI